jgi:hypothetical protein
VNLQLAWWEAEELLEHFTARPDIWAQDVDNPALWLRTQDSVEREPLLMLQVVPPTSTARFRQYLVQVTPLTDPAWAFEYVTGMLAGWTSYADRLDLERLYQADLGLPEKEAKVAALAAAHTFLVGTLSSELRQDSEQWKAEPRALPQAQEILGQWPVGHNQGWVRLMVGPHGFVLCNLSIHGPQSHEMGFNVTEFTGHLVPRQGRSVSWLDRLRNTLFGDSLV